MPATFTEALPYLLIAAALLLVALWFVIRASRRTKVVDKTSGDVLDEGADRAARNQALIDAPRSMEQNFGEITAAANADPVAAAGASADAEAGASVAPTMPVAEPAPAPAPAPAPSGDDLRRIKGLGPKLVTILAEQGVTSFAQIAAWSDADVARIDATLGRFQGRITRDQWVDQAKLLAAGDESSFTERFGQNS